MRNDNSLQTFEDVVISGSTFTAFSKYARSITVDIAAFPVYFKDNQNKTLIVNPGQTAELVSDPAADPIYIVGIKSTDTGGDTVTVTLGDGTKYASNAPVADDDASLAVGAKLLQGAVTVLTAGSTADFGSGGFPSGAFAVVPASSPGSGSMQFKAGLRGIYFNTPIAANDLSTISTSGFIPAADVITTWPLVLINSSAIDQVRIINNLNVSVTIYSSFGPGSFKQV